MYQLSIGSCYDSTTLRKTGTAARIVTFNKIGHHGWVSVVHCFSRSVSSLRLCISLFVSIRFASCRCVKLCPCSVQCEEALGDLGAFGAVEAKLHMPS